MRLEYIGVTVLGRRVQDTLHMMVSEILDQLTIHRKYHGVWRPRTNIDDIL